jgi:hypothetical protein
MLSNLLNKLTVVVAKAEDKIQKVDWNRKLEDAKLVAIGAIAVAQMETKKFAASSAHNASVILDNLSKKCQ